MFAQTFSMGQVQSAPNESKPLVPLINVGLNASGALVHFGSKYILGPSVYWVQYNSGPCASRVLVCVGSNTTWVLVHLGS